ncbi:MAG: HAMP domain-containing sensor histidine kinase [Deferrisomatales bacterium]
MKLSVHGPGSFLRLIWIGFVCVSLPLLFGVLDAGIFTGRLARRSAEAVERAARSASESRLLVDQVVSLERRARQFYVLGETPLLRDYEERRQTLAETVARLEPLLASEEQRERARQVVELEQDVYRALSTGPQPKGALVQAMDRFVEMNRLARDTLADTHRRALSQAQTIRREADAAQRRLWLVALAVVPTTYVLAAVFASLLSRPVRQIIRGIRPLGFGDFSSEIVVEGPRDLELLGTRLDRIRRRLAELEAERAKFLAHVSHELKTPLTAIREGVDLLADGVVGPVSEPQGEVIGILKSNAVRLQGLIDNLLRFSFARAQRSEVQRTAVDLSAVAQDVVADHRPAALAKGLDLQVRSEPGVVLTAERDRVRTVVDNLVSNAVKFTPEGGTVAVGVLRVGDRVVVEVADSGPGIPGGERHRVTEPFFRGAASGGEVPGTGLGLAIVDEYVHRMGGRIAIQDGARGGARLRVELPRDPEEERL